MDFDDLLADPFEDPFAKPRSGSPDPWASFSHQPSTALDAHDPYEDSYKSPYDDGRSTTPTTESYVTGDRGDSSQSSLADPLEAAAVNAEEDPPAPSGPTSPRTPGFRESISVLNSTDHTQTIAEPEPTSSSSPSSAPLSFTSVPTAAPSPPLSRSPERLPPISPIVSLSLSTSKAPSPIVSPLEKPATSSNFNHSFASLALGGEAIGGWQADQSSWVNDKPAPSVSSANNTEEDDDDDVPILKSRLISSDTSNLVRAHSPLSMFSPCLFFFAY